MRFWFLEGVWGLGFRVYGYVCVGGVMWVIGFLVFGNGVLFVFWYMFVL